MTCSADTNKTSLDLTQVYQDDSFRIANSCNDGRQLKGYISEARVWAKALNGNDLKNNMCYVDPATDGLLAYWRFNEKADGKKVEDDLTGHGYKATYSSSAMKWVDNVRCPE